MKSFSQIIIIGICFHVLIIMYQRKQKINEYSGYLMDLGLPKNIVNKMSFKELQDSYVYLIEYSSKKIKLTQENNEYLYNSIKKIQSKYKIFNL
jgi:hypothetical protein